jgi:phenylalanine ammonia-lyase
MPPDEENATEATCMPRSWTKATMLVRCNSTARGHSAVTLHVLEGILELLRLDITPVIPLRGSVSASGDLMPLAYIAGVLEGNSDVHARRADGSVTTADKILAEQGIEPITFGPKEALGLVNGTAASTALASLAMYEAHQLAVLSQSVTAMTVEALQGNSESFHPFIHQVRPHAGQIESGRNILAFLQGSSLAQGIKGGKVHHRSGLEQDRYPLRSSPQWIGPQLEDLCSAHHQITVELNSSADNPLIDLDGQDVLYGANFQAAAVTSAMEKTRLALQMLGKLCFAQGNEMMDPALSNGLPTNLAADDPSISFTMKGVDINMAAYMSELAYLANPVSTHVQNAEMQNQSINSLAFISARMTMKSIELLSMMLTSCIYVGCQALDLRALQCNFFAAAEPIIKETTSEAGFARFLAEAEIAALNTTLAGRVAQTWQDGARIDIHDRFENIAQAAVSTFLSVLEGHSYRAEVFRRIEDVDCWRDTLKRRLSETYEETFKQFCVNQNTPDYLGVSSKALYNLVRRDLAVPFHAGAVEHPTHGKEPRRLDGARKTIGGWIPVIQKAVINGKASCAIYDGHGDALPNGAGVNGHKLNGDLAP